MKLTLLRDYPNGRYAMTFDVIIVGGSYAGISAGMQLARARRRVLVMDTGLRRNRFARASTAFSARMAAIRRPSSMTPAPSCWPIPASSGCRSRRRGEEGG